MAAEARETRRQELLEKITEGQAAKKQKLEQNSGSCESQEACGSQVAEGNQTGDSQASGEPQEAGRVRFGVRDQGKEERELLGIWAGSLESWRTLPLDS